MVESMTHDALVIKGGKPLQGEIVLKGAKNFIPKALVAALLTSDTCKLHDVPHIQDTQIVEDIFKLMNVGFSFVGSDSVEISAKKIKNPDPVGFCDMSGKSRIPILMCAPLLHRNKRALVPELGGCNIGSRPVDFHIKALKKMGARLVTEGEYTYLQIDDKLKGADIHLEYSSVGATEQIILASVLAEGKTELTNAAVEPEILDLIGMLQKMGANIRFKDTRHITIEGVKKLSGYNHYPIVDRIEAASWACAALVTNGKIKIKNARHMDMLAFINKFQQAGGGFEIHSDGIVFFRKQKEIQPVKIETNVHPGFMTDWQQPFTLALTQAIGSSIVHETVYEERFGYVKILNDMGADIQLSKDCLGGTTCRFNNRNYSHSAIIHGKTPLIPQEIVVPDLRAGFTYVIAALVADGVSTITNVQTIYRGYEFFVEKLRSLGAEIVE